MSELKTFHELFAYSDRCNRLVFAAAGELDDARLDQPIEISVGTLRRLLHHLYTGESVWLQRWMGVVEARWPGECGQTPVGEIASMIARNAADRDAFVATLTEVKLDGVQTYRDSKGSLFRGTLRQMLIQGIVHSIHHRAQIVNAIRRLGGKPPELDFMMSVRERV